MSIIGVSLGWYLFCLILALSSVLKYVNDRVLLKKTSVGQTVGFLFILFLFGTLVGIVLSILVGGADWFITFLASLVYISIFISIMGILRTYALFYARKRVGIAEFNKATLIQPVYNRTVVFNILAVCGVLAGVMMGSVGVMVGGFLISVGFATYLNLKIINILETATDLTEEELSKQEQAFNQAIESNKLDELDNTNNTLYKKSKRKVTKYLKKRG